MAELPEPSFIERNPEQVTSELIGLYETMTGKTLQPAQPERLFIDVIAYRESLLRIQIQAAAVKNLVRFSSGVMLDELGVLVGCPRLPAQPARTTMRFTLAAVQGFDVTIAAGTGRGSKDGKVTFLTDVALTIPAGAVSGDVGATADTVGPDGNGYLAGEVNAEIEPIAYLLSAVNTSVTTGGAADEDDDHYRERIILKPDSYSTAGPEDAYIYWTKTAHQDIVDVAVLSSSATVVDIYPLMRQGLPASEILDLVSATLAVRKRRPLTDLVQTHTPTEVTYRIESAVTLYDWVTDDDAAVIAGIVRVLTGFAAAQRASLGTDLVIDQVRQQIMSCRGVYKAPIAEPAADRVLADNEWLNCTDITITIAGRVRA